MDLSLFSRLGQSRVLVVGDVMLDRYFQGDTSRISPEAPVPVVKVSKTENRLGGAANVARNIAHIDGQVSLLGIVGEDEPGRFLQQSLESATIKSVLVVQKEHPTITKLRVISRHQQVVRLDFEEPFEASAASEVVEQFAELIEEAPLVVFSDYNKGTLQGIESMIRLAKEKGKMVLVDPKVKDLSCYRGADLITPNMAEFLLAGGDNRSEEAIADSARAIMQRCHIKAILLTRSEQGMSLITATDKIDLPAQVHEVSDVTGAGDTVVATLASMLSIGASLADAAEIANIAAGIVVTKLGAATITPEELSARVNQQIARSHHYHADFSDVRQHIEFARQRGEKIVFTNGCFDILHAGHVQYLEQAKALGDRLVVGLNTDESVARLKGPDRPINSLKPRAMVLEGLASVDWVIPFKEDTPEALIRSVAPDVLVKGGDYTIETIVGADFVLEQGGDVYVLDFLDGCSTSAVIHKIQQRNKKQNA